MEQLAFKHMALSSERRKKLRDALINAFPEKSSLEQMLWFELDKNLDTIASGDNLEAVVFNLIKKAEAENWVEDLIDAAQRENPGNQSLKYAARVLNFNPPSNCNSELRNTVLESDVTDSTLSEIPVTGDEASEVEADYTKLQNLLENKEFGKADLETLKIILWITNRQQGERLNRKDIDDFPNKDLHTINQLWLVGSCGKFGFSVQKQIWIDNGGKPGVFDEETFEHFVKKVEWTEEDKVIPDLRAKNGHLPLGLYTACGGLDLMKWWASIERYHPVEVRAKRRARKVKIQIQIPAEEKEVAFVIDAIESFPIKIFYLLIFLGLFTLSNGFGWLWFFWWLCVGVVFCLRKPICFFSRYKMKPTKRNLSMLQRRRRMRSVRSAYISFLSHTNL